VEFWERGIKNAMRIWRLALRVEKDRHGFGPIRRTKNMENTISLVHQTF
jgi:hypothetical protein